jgi:exonuclease SbcC
MIPVSLTLSGFLSYKKPVDIDFTSFELACIAGPNGAGKSSLLDAMTWALFGRARKHDESIINIQSDTAEVSFTFQYEGNTYRVTRVNPRGDTKMVEFHLQTGEREEGSPIWKALTERTLRATDERIEEVLRLDYETFTNAAFFLQGEADQFTQQSPSSRKRILSKILGLEVWETYRKQAYQDRKTVEAEITRLDGRLSEINKELAEEEDRKQRLAALQEELAQAEKDRQAQEDNLKTIRALEASVQEQRKQVRSLTEGLEKRRAGLEKTKQRLAEREEERAEKLRFLEKEGQIKAEYAAWEKAQQELEEWEGIAEQFRDQEKRRQEPLTEIAAEKARLEQELEALKNKKAQLEQDQTAVSELEQKRQELEEAISEKEKQLERRDQKKQELTQAQQKLAEARVENPRLREEMHQLKERIDRLKASAGSACPLCGQELSPEEREDLVERLTGEGKTLGDRYRTNKTVLAETDQIVKDLQINITRLSAAEESLRTLTREADQLVQRIKDIQKAQDAWQETGAVRLAEIQQALEEETYAAQARERLAQIDQKLKKIGYDATQHDQVRKTVTQGASLQGKMVELEKARAALQPLEREIQDLTEQLAEEKKELTRDQEKLQQAEETLQEIEGNMPEVEEAERKYLMLQEQENRLQRQVGAALQKVQVLETQKKRKQKLKAQREDYTLKISQYKQLELAFGKNGVPALLIEQSLPQIETKANEILDRLSNGEMSVTFKTQRAYKDQSRDDLKETLDIHIRDRAGERDYEMYSGGEAFRVNFAIRLALSYVLAQRAGARLQTLVIDEGFGSQDAIGRQRLVEAINIIRDDFKKILVITHIDELKDAFSTQLMVEKTPQGSRVSISQ